MKTMKKLLAVLLAAIMMFSVGMVAFAAETGDETPAAETAEEGEANIVSSSHACPYCGEEHDDKDIKEGLTGFWHIILYVFETFKSVFEKVKEMAA